MQESRLLLAILVVSVGVGVAVIIFFFSTSTTVPLPSKSGKDNSVVTERPNEQLIKVAETITLRTATITQSDVTNTAKYATMIVRKVQGNPEIYIVDNSTKQRVANAPVIDDHIMKKFPQLKDAMRAADQRLLNFTLLCRNNGCSNGLPLPVYAQPNYIVKIPESVAEAIIHERALEFQLDITTLPRSHVYNTFVNNTEGITYAIDIFLTY